MGKFKRYFIYLRCMKDLLLSHHPNCPKFDNHVIRIKNTRFCIGCFIGYPSAFLTILLVYFFNITVYLDSQMLFILSLILISSFILSPLHLTRIKLIKILQKLAIGIGSGFLFWYIWILPNSFIINAIYFFLVFGLLLAVLNFYHAHGFLSICKKCEFSLNWEKCGGFEEIQECFQRNNLNDFIKSEQKIKK
ncbi:MAG: hypothetical protein EU542_05190 [Promethearchaeota archaeon]|nr:MAG: hypothetical protein EU542_05190 [Candidatus Lokiarchaeota archaeon]